MPEVDGSAAHHPQSAVEVHQARKSLVGQRIEYQGEWHSVAHIDHYGVWLVSLEAERRSVPLRSRGRTWLARIPLSFCGYTRSLYKTPLQGV